MVLFCSHSDVYKAIFISMVIRTVGEITLCLRNDHMKFPSVYGSLSVPAERQPHQLHSESSLT